MSLAKRIAQNTVYLAIGKVASTGIGVLTIALLLRYLSPDDYGRYTTVLAFVLLYGTVTDLGLNLTTTQDISEPEADAGRTISAVFTFRIIANLFLLALLPAILWLFPYDRPVSVAIGVASLLFFFQSLIQVLSSYFQKTLAAGKVALAELGGRVALLGGTVAAIRLNLPLLEIIGIVSASAAIQFLILYIFTCRAIRLRLLVDRVIWKRIFAKTWPIALSVVFTTIYFKGDTIILSLFRPYEEVGIYGAAYKILEVLITLPILFMGLLLPHLSEAFARRENERFNRLLQRSWDALALLTLPLATGTLVTAERIIAFVAGSDYADAANVLRILIMATSVIFLGSIFTHAVVAVRAQKRMVPYYAATALVAIALYVIYIPTYTYYAAAAITVLAELGIALAATREVRRASRFKISLEVFYKALAASIIMAALLALAPSLSILMAAPLAALVYALVLLSLGAVPEEFKIWQTRKSIS